MMRYVFQHFLVCGILCCLFCVPVFAATSTTPGVGRDDVTATTLPGAGRDDATATTHSWDWGGGEAGGSGADRRSGFEIFGMVMSTVFNGVWNIMGNEMPLLGITYRQFWFGGLAISVALWLWHRATGGSVQRSGSTNNPRINSRRKDDEF